MSDRGTGSPIGKIATLVQQLLAQRSIDRPVGSQEDLRRAGLTSLDMISLVLSVEREFGVTVPEASINPGSFRSIEAISQLVASLLARP